MAKVTIQRIAKELGLSRNTVSMALRGNELVAPKTRKMVLQCARSMGYAGLDFLQEEAGQKAAGEAASRAEEEYRVMILRKPDVALYWDKVVSGISEEASKNHCRTHVAVVTDEEEEGQKLPPGLDGSFHAVFCVKLMNVAYIAKLRQMGIPVFLLDSYKEAAGEIPCDIVKAESFQPVVELTRHLLGQGMRRIAFLNEGSSIYETMHDRLDGYLYAMGQAGITPGRELLLLSGENVDREFYNTANFEKIVEGFRELPEAVVCGNDEIAKFLTQAFRRKGIRVPEDVALTGFDNDEEGMLDPFFTTVSVDAKWLGKRMVQCFLWRMEHPDAPYEKISVAGRVVIRRSSLKQTQKGMD